MLIEKTLIWKLGKNLANIATGHFAEKFRPHYSIHQDLSGFDYQNGIYYVNVAEGAHRCWNDCRKYGFLSAGQHPKYSDPIRTLVPGDIVAAYFQGQGYVGIGKVIRKAVPVRQFIVDGKSLRELALDVPNIFQNSESDANSEYLVQIEWIKTVDADKAKWQKKDSLFSSQLVKASLQGQKKR